MKIWLGKMDGSFRPRPFNYHATGFDLCSVVVVAETKQEAMAIVRERHQHDLRPGRWQWQELTVKTPGIKLLA